MQDYTIGQLQRRIFELAVRLDELERKAPRPHREEHEIAGGDVVRPAVRNSGTLLGSRHKYINFGTGLTATVDTTNDEVDVILDETAWAAWTPSYSAEGSMTYTSVDTSVARWRRIGKLVFFYIRADGTTGGTASRAIYFSLPSTPSTTTGNWLAFTASVRDGGIVAGLGLNLGGASPEYVQVFRYDLANFGLGASRQIMVQGFYEIA